jgi:lipid-binding SYLF domain-containing protein
MPNSLKEVEKKMMKKMRFHLRHGLAVAIAGALCVGGLVAPVAADSAEQQLLVDKARITFQSVIEDDHFTWLRENLHQAKALLIVPSLLKGGFILGGSGGNGVLVARNEKTGMWSQPAFYTVGSVTFGLQIGGEAAEVIMMARTRKALDSLYSSSFKLGGDTSIAAGPVGAGAKANVMTDFVSFTQTKGAYAGLSLEGAVIKTRDGWNEAYYGKAVRPLDILVKGSVSNPGSKELRQTIANAERGGRGTSGSQGNAGSYVVERGDTLYGISQRYGVPVAEIRRLNNIEEGQAIYPGQKIMLQ